MPLSEAVMCIEIQHGSPQYLETVALRAAVLREPLGLAFSQDELATEKDSFHIACMRDGLLAACLVLEPRSGIQIRMRQFAVRSDFQHKGYGNRLARHAESFARTLGYQEIILHARETALGFYEKLGYAVEGGRFIEVSIPHFQMRKTLVGS